MKNDIDQIRKTVHAYFDGVSTKSYEKFLESWHPEARMNFVKDGQASSVGRDFWEGWCKQDSDNEQTTKAWIESIDIKGSIAVVRSKMIRDTPDTIYDFTDLLTLLKNGEEKWVIMSKAYNSVITKK
ncbi:MAG: nuclear transport factor 2 family protein [Candidatus Thorarchaeota archaeon]